MVITLIKQEANECLRTSIYGSNFRQIHDLTKLIFVLYLSKKIIEILLCGRHFAICCWYQVKRSKGCPKDDKVIGVTDLYNYRGLVSAYKRYRLSGGLGEEVASCLGW